MPITEQGLSIDKLIDMAGMGKDKRSPMSEQKANENIDVSANANWYDAYGAVNDIKDNSMAHGNLLSRLAEGYEGSDLPVSYPIPYNVTNYFMQGKTAWVSEARPAFNNKPATDAKGTLTQADLILQMGVTDKMLKHSTDRQLYNRIVQMLSKAATTTMESMIINGDTEAGAIGNVNSDDQLPATTFADDGGASYHATLLDHGIRENAVTNSKTYDVSAFDSDDMKTVQALLAERYQARENDLIWLFNPSTYLKAQTDDAFKLAYSTANPTVDGKAGSRLWGIDMVVTDLVPKTEADGKVSATPGNNTLGQFLCVFKPAIRWGFGQDVKFEVERVQGYGFELTLTMEFGFVILDVANTCAMGRDVTI